MNGKTVRFGLLGFAAPALAMWTGPSGPKRIPATTQKRPAPAGNLPYAGDPRPLDHATDASKPATSAPPFCPHKTLRPVNFICRAPQAKSVSLVGDFNHWNPAAHPMQQMPDRAWLLQVELPHGHHRYAFLVDGLLELDPKAQGVARNDQGQQVSLVPVS